MTDPKPCHHCPCPNTGHTQDDGTCLTVGCACPRYAPPQGTWPLVRLAEYPHGLRCMDCHRELPDGGPYGNRLIGLIGDSPLTETVCVYCAIQPEGAPA